MNPTVINSKRPNGANVLIWTS